MTKSCLILILMLFLSTASVTSSHNSLSSTSWQYLGKNENGSLFYYDKDRIVRLTNNETRVWVKLIPGHKENIYKLLTDFFSWEATDEVMKKYDDYHHTLLLCAINCMSNTVISVASEDYDRSGKLLHCSITDKEDLAEIMKFRFGADLDFTIYPNTVWEDLYGAVCMRCADLRQEKTFDTTLYTSK